MNGLNEIRNVNNQAVFDSLKSAHTKAKTAREQNHPQANAIEAHYQSVKREVGPSLVAQGFKLPD